MEEHLLGEVILLHGSKYLEGLVSSSRLGDILGSPKTKGGETHFLVELYQIPILYL